MRRLFRLVCTLRRDRRGASVIELAIVAPILVVMIMGMIDVAMGYARSIALEQAAQRAIELIAVGNNSGSDYQFVRQEAAAAAGEPIDDVTLDRWLECDGARKSSFDGTCGETEQVARYVSVRIDDEFKPMFRLFGSVPIAGDAAVRVQ